VRCVVQAQGHLGLPDTALPSPARQDGDIPLTPAEWARLGSGLKARRSRLTSATSYLDSWLPSLSRTIGLDETEAAVLGLAIGYSQDGHITRLWDEMSDNRGRTPFLRADADLFALMLGLLEPRVRTCLSAEGRLRDSGLLAVDEDGDITVLRRLTSLLARRAPLDGDIRSLLLSPPRPADLPWDAFCHLGQQGELAAELLAAAIAKREPGVGILLYGPPGTGKTAFAAALAGKVGALLHPVGESDSDGEEPTGSERLAELRLSQRLLGDAASALLFDEAEDLFMQFPFGERQARSRVFLHRLLEQGRAPVIWTVNDISVLGPAVARRMMLCIEVRQPNLAIRTKLWGDMARSEGVVLTAADASELARSVPAAPGILRNALRATRLVDGSSKTALQVASGIVRVVNGGRLPLPEESTPVHYDPALVQADCDLAALARKMTQGNTPYSPTLLLSGPPGCGKSAYVRYLSAQMGFPVLMKRASDLIGPFVGESEARIASAFAEARDTGAFLVFDEADSLLADRRGAHRSWEVSQVNEMLTWMESHPLPFACTTNLPDHLDRASLRRFLFKARFGYLCAEQTQLAFQRFFGAAAPAGLTRLEHLTPADFALVSRRTTFLDTPPKPDALVAMLAAECVEREGSRRIGFAA
jgi:AAA+ superfamily predicted ATPase